MFTGEYKKDELLEAARSGNEEKLMSLLTPLNVNCHASDGRKVILVGELVLFGVFPYYDTNLKDVYCFNTEKVLTK